MEVMIADAAQRVMNQLGPLHRECVYTRALAAELRARGLHASVEHPVPVVYEASNGFKDTVATERADIYINETSVIEAKVGDTITEAAILQAERYARALDAANAFVVVFSRQNSVCTTKILI